MTSSLKNSVHRRNHKERSQLASRAKLGILEKHKDYVQRARDYHSKQDRLKRLRQKAADRNKDEFYFSMVKEKTKGGVAIKGREGVALPVDMVKVLKTQDENYMRVMRNSNAKKIDNIKIQLTTMADLVKNPLTEDVQQGLQEDEIRILSEAGVLQPSKKGKNKVKHIVFAESAEEARTYAYASKTQKRHLRADIETSDDTQQPHEVDLGWKVEDSKRKRRKSSHTPKPGSSLQTIKGDDMGLDDLDTQDEDPQPSSTSVKRRLLKELSARLLRDKQLRYAEREFEMQRLLMGKGARSKIAGVEKVEGDSDSEEDEDEIDARKGKRRTSVKKVDEATYKPRVYKWKLERKR